MKKRALTLLVVLSGLLAAKAWSTRPAEVGEPAGSAGSRVVPESTAADGDGDWLPGTAGLAVRTAEHYVGTPYRWGGDTVAGGFDCSGFVRHVYALNGVTLPRVTGDQARSGWAVDPDPGALKPGDLLFFGEPAGEIDHVAIYAGGGRIIHSSSTLGGVRIDRLDRDSWYATRLVAARRVVEP